METNRIELAPNSPLTLATLTKLMEWGNKESAFIDVGRPKTAGGTGILNINANENDCIAVLNVLREIGCNCMFVAPVPCFGLVPFAIESNESEFKRFETCCASIPPAYFSVHQYHGGTGDCKRLFSQLMVQELASPVEATVEAKQLISQFTKRE